MSRKDRLQVRYPYQLRTQSIDAVALVVALLWVCVTVMLALNADVSLVMALKRATVGAILVYALVYVGLHLMARSPYPRGNAKKDGLRGTEPKAVRPEETAQEEAPGEAQERK